MAGGGPGGRRSAAGGRSRGKARSRASWVEEALQMCRDILTLCLGPGDGKAIKVPSRVLG